MSVLFAAAIDVVPFAAHAQDDGDYGYTTVSSDGGDYGYTTVAPTDNTNCDCGSYGYTTVAPSTDYGYTTVAPSTSYTTSTTYSDYSSSYGYGGYSYYPYSYSYGYTYPYTYSTGTSYTYPTYTYPSNSGVQQTCVNNSCNNNNNVVNNGGTVAYTEPNYTYPSTYTYTQPLAIYGVPTAVVSSGPSVSLSQLPYTGLELGFWGTIAYWGFLIFWCVVAAYLIAVKRVQNTLAHKVKVFLFGESVKPAQSHGVHPVTHGHNLPPKVQAQIVKEVIDPTDDFILSQIHGRAHA
jgi:hypothetical protein